MPDLSTLLWIIAVWVAVSIVVPTVFWLLAARASRKREESRQRDLAASLEAQRERLARERKVFETVKGWHRRSPEDGGDRAA